MNTISMSRDRRTALIEPGATWDQVYTVLEKEELNVAGGRVAGVGVGGLILGGMFATHSTGITADHDDRRNVTLLWPVGYGL
jgi:hypothetical protein